MSELVKLPQKNKEPEYIIGLDVSTTTIGVCLYEDMGDHGELKVLEHVTPKLKDKTLSNTAKLFIKADMFYDAFVDKYVEYNVTKIIIEEPLLRSNNVNTVGTLLRFNGIISKMMYDKFNVVPEYISSYDARKYGFPELMEKRLHDSKGKPYTEAQLSKKNPVLFGGYPKDVDKKKVVWEKVAELEPQVEWLRNKKGDLTKEVYDMSDAIAVVFASMKKNGFWK